MRRYQNIRGSARKAYKKFLRKWEACESCQLSEGRTQVVQFRGDLPARVVFIGEGPGVSEDAVGVPFIGPSGNLLSKMIRLAIKSSWGTDRVFTYCLLNIVGCLPKIDESLIPPKAVHITACSPRVIDLLRIAKPRLIVRVGKSATKFSPTNQAFKKLLKADEAIGDFFEVPTVDIVHPSYILRQEDKPTQELAYKRAFMTLEGAFKNLSESL